MDETKIFKYNLKQLNEYSDMLLTGKYETKYIVGKIEFYGKSLAAQAKFADKQIKKESE